MGLGVDADDLALVFQIVIDAPRAGVGGAEFRLSFEWNRGRDLAGLCGDDGCRFAVSAEQIDLFLSWLVKHPVGALARVHFR